MGMLGKVKAAIQAETEGEAPKTFLDKIINTTPVVMTVVATILAGLSSSEMSTAQYHRSMAAQNQSKAGDQWGLFQAKRIRQANAENAMDVLQNAGTGNELSPESLQQNAIQLANFAGIYAASHTERIGPTPPLWQRTIADGNAVSEEWKHALADPSVENALQLLSGTDLPPVSEKTIDDPDVKAALAAINAGQSDTQINSLVRKVTREKFEATLALAQANANAFDAATKPMQKGIDQIAKLVAMQSALARRMSRELAMPAAIAPAATSEPTTEPGSDPGHWKSFATTLVQQTEDLAGGFAAARLRYTARRYVVEAHYNMVIAQLYELDVHRSGAASDRHRDRSRDFFYGMLGAQAAVTIATLSLAVRNRSLLWTFATVAGALAVGSGVYVYLFT